MFSRQLVYLPYFGKTQAYQLRYFATNLKGFVTDI